MSGSFAGLKRLYNALAGKIRDAQQNPAQHKKMRSRAYIAPQHTGLTSHDHRTMYFMEWMVANRNIDGSWKITMESGTSGTTDRTENRFITRRTRVVAHEAEFGVAAETIRNYETRMGQNHTQFSAANPTCDHVGFIAPEPKTPRKTASKTVSLKP